MLHTNICSSSKKLKDLRYYIDNLNITFTFIGLSETWATESNPDLLEIPAYKHKQCIQIRREGEIQIYAYTIVFNIEEGVN